MDVRTFGQINSVYLNDKEILETGKFTREEIR